MLHTALEDTSLEKFVYIFYHWLHRTLCFRINSWVRQQNVFHEEDPEKVLQIDILVIFSIVFDSLIALLQYG